MQEWSRTGTIPSRHRHVSHLWGLYPDPDFALSDPGF
ncbi:MAG: hypothetical protein ACLUEV_12075 [Alistipes sp.]